MIKTLPGPKQLPLAGNAHQLGGTGLHLTLEDWAERFGPVYRIAIGRRPVVVLSDGEAINAVLRQRPAGFRRWSVIADAMAEMGDGEGVFAAEGDDWRRQRRLVVTGLHADHLHRFHAVIRTAAERLHRRLRAEAAGGAVFDVHGAFQAYAVDVTSALAFGHDVNTLEGGDDELRGHLHRIFVMLSRRINAPVPYWRWVKLPADRALDRSVEAVRDAVAGFIAEGRARMAAEPDRPPQNLLEAMLAAPESHDDTEVAANVQTMLLAGEDTTSHSLAWAVWFLATHPEAQERLAAEARGLLGSELVPDHEATTQLRYGEAVLREAIRLRSAAPMMFVEALADTEVAGTAVPAGTRLILLTRQVSLQESSYERARTFDPDRWLDAGAAPDPKAMLAFGAGPRFCPGRNLAFQEAKAALAMIAAAFEITLDPEAEPVREHFAFTMAPSAVPIRLTERRP